MIEYIKREDTKIVVGINTGLNIKDNVLLLKLDTGEEIFAELLKEQLNKQLKEFKKEIARQAAKYPLLYLNSEEVSELKSMLVKEWNGAKHYWK